MFNPVSFIIRKVVKLVGLVGNDVHYKSFSHWQNKQGQHYYRIEFDIRTQAPKGAIGSELVDQTFTEFDNKVIVVKWTGNNLIIVPDFDPRKEAK